MSEEKRHSIRTPLTLTVKVLHPKLGEMVLKTADISDGGIFILASDQLLPPEGDQVQVQVQGLPQEAPVLDAKVVRVQQDGMGLQFMNQAL